MICSTIERIFFTDLLICRADAKLVKTFLVHIRLVSHCPAFSSCNYIHLWTSSSVLYSEIVSPRKSVLGFWTSIYPHSFQINPFLYWPSFFYIYVQNCNTAGYAPTALSIIILHNIVLIRSICHSWPQGSTKKFNWQTCAVPDIIFQ